MAAAVAAVACSGDKDRDGDPVAPGAPATAAVSIAAMPAPALLSDADGTPNAPVDDNERINSWFVVFVETSSGRVVRIISRTDPETEIGPSAGPVERETFKCVVPSGTYDLYAFANLTPDDVKQYAGITFVEGNAIDRAALEGASWSQILNLHTGLVPMSGALKGIQVRNTIEETFAIEVVRMVAKVEFDLTNMSGKELQVTGVSIDPVTTSAVSLFPTGASGISYAHLGQSAYTPLADAAYDKIEYAQALTLANQGKGALSFYIQESVSTYESAGAFIVGLNISYGKGEASDAAATYEQLNITNDIRGYINRNDWIKIPINISQYDVQAEVNFYPPIGGYPAYRSTKDKNGSQVFTFGTQGEFSINPKIVDKATRAELTPNYFKIEIAPEGVKSVVKAEGESPEGESPEDESPEDESPEGESAEGESAEDESGEDESPDWSVVDWASQPACSETNKGIFTRIPAIVETPSFGTGGMLTLRNEIHGELNTSEGIARIPLKIYIYDTPYDASAEVQPQPKWTYSRTIYVIRNNSVKPSAAN